MLMLNIYILNYKNFLILNLYVWNSLQFEIEDGEKFLEIANIYNSSLICGFEIKKEIQNQYLDIVNKQIKFFKEKNISILFLTFTKYFKF